MSTACCRKKMRRGMRRVSEASRKPAITEKSDSKREIVIGAVDIGGTKIAVGVVDDGGKVLSRLESPTDAPGGYKNGLARMVQMLRRTSRDACVEIYGIVIGSTRVVHPESGALADLVLLP